MRFLLCGVSVRTTSFFLNSNAEKRLEYRVAVVINYVLKDKIVDKFGYQALLFYLGFKLRDKHEPPIHSFLGVLNIKILVSAEEYAVRIVFI